MSGSNNPMYGINVFDSLPWEKQEELRQLQSKRSAGENNPMYGISPKDRMTPERYEIWRNKMRIRDFNGKNNPNYGNKTLHDKVKDNPELRLKYYSRPKEQNGRARKVYIYDKNKILVNSFDYIGACAEWFKYFLQLKATPTSIRQAIITSITKNKNYRGYKFSYTQI